MTAPILPLHPCPHGCGARLGISSRTADGERGRCGQCRGVSEYRAGQLHAITWEHAEQASLATILQHGTRAAMTPEQITAAAHRHADSSIRLDSERAP
ncbi:hypothetical protein [Deinococcus kurensis]|uniref:hypothetical protein n=1 Tax=Deinococcus kurensis TaxID=2662757 RepID=UPI0012D2C8E8|nr:hypothetical protein [Deinococcus kurensis]